MANKAEALGYSHDFCSILEDFFFLRLLCSESSCFLVLGLPLSHGPEQEDVAHTQLSFQSFQLCILSLFKPLHLCKATLTCA